MSNTHTLPVHGTAYPLPEFRALPFTVNFVNRDDAVNWCLRVMKIEGFSVVMGATESETLKKETPTEFCKRVGISVMTFHRRRKQPGCPEYFRQVGRTGRVILLISNPALEAWMEKRQ